MEAIQGVLKITEEASKLIDDGLARIEGGNVVWNKGSGHTGVVEWGKFVPIDSNNSSEVTNLVLGASMAIATISSFGLIIVNNRNRRQTEYEKKTNNLVTCLTLLILESESNNVHPSTLLDLKIAIREYIENKKIIKHGIDSDLLNNLERVIKKIDNDEFIDIKDNIIQLDEYIKVAKLKKAK
ncbi:hypothetical protein [Streptococcus parauberis]|uniref:hypothetical protein n=1 Tax=Streptococcus parauberis TaxID=1348 RepID=UPI000789B9DD|nr:hypothetical protein [Streptococcus parauberis]KYP19813.1 hypothetical protein TN39_01118 [Streptococcus parauberis]KYP19909.1 hypothetical protein AKL14_00713 [Streptococcus parauberis]KYP22772.1 hypothetical protein AKL13_00095 [Streptococcus parauberis]KYP24070.1 hypothetical protein TP84_01801 [Streptococcus parauberis]KYP25282.1 hypothetical protein TM50_01499 [Streptococcus parauberis]